MFEEEKRESIKKKRREKWRWDFFKKGERLQVFHNNIK